ncbi:hypothetical protein GCM10023191_015220 [Actinoallomurus oryzae]|uniref:Uncharacterized protein n=1 Tax=Actinoallomurus oryzae TaxID=502180 RepID=A0ABP8PH27_9ACTN
MTALGDNVHIFARPHRREALVRCFEAVLGCTVRTVEFPGIAEPMLVVGARTRPVVTATAGRSGQGVTVRGAVRLSRDRFHTP